MPSIASSATLYRFSRPVLMVLAGLWLGWVQRIYPVNTKLVTAGIALVLITTIITLFFRNEKLTRVISYMNPVIDLVLITVAVSVTGGAESPLFVAYIPVVLSVSLVWPNAYSLQFVATASIIYIAIILSSASPIASASTVALAVMVSIPTMFVVYFHGNSLIVSSLLEAQRRMNIEQQQRVIKHKARAYQLQAMKAKEQAYTDPLTGLRNHGSFQIKLREVLSETYHKKSRSSLLMIDIDDFKKLNDTYGHQFGDQVLKRVAQTIKGSVRQGDIVARYGGEEMSVIFPHCDAGTAKLNAERIRSNIKKLVFQNNDGANVRVTVSIGVSDSKGGEVPENLIERADMALYNAKRTGKDKVVVFEDEQMWET